MSLHVSSSQIRDCVIIIWSGGGGEKIRGGGIGENDNKRKGVGNRI